MLGAITFFKHPALQFSFLYTFLQKLQYFSITAKYKNNFYSQHHHGPKPVVEDHVRAARGARAAKVARVDNSAKAGDLGNQTMVQPTHRRRSELGLRTCTRRR